MALKEEKVFVTSGRKMACVRRETSAVSCIESNDRAQKPTPKAATPSEPSMTRVGSVSRKRSIKGKSNPGVILRQPCRYYLKGTCKRSPCEHWHPPECQLYRTEAGCKEKDKAAFYSPADQWVLTAASTKEPEEQ